MSLIKVIVSLGIEKSAKAIAKGSSELVYKQVQESGHKLFSRVRVQPYNRPRTAVVATCRFLFLPVLVFILIPLPFFVFSERALLLQDFDLFIVEYFNSFAIIYIFMSLFTPMVYIGSLIKNPHEKRSGLGAEVNTIISDATKSSLVVEPLQVTGITAFKWGSVDKLVTNNTDRVTVVFIQPKHWFKRLFTYPGIGLAFSSATDADVFCVTGNDYLKNLDLNTKEAQMITKHTRRLSSNGL
jgi:hypothetical protein